MKYALQNIFNNFYVNDWPQLKKKLLLSAKERQKKSNSRILRSAPDYIFLHISAVGTKLISAERRKLPAGLILLDSYESLIQKYLSMLKWDILVARYSHSCCLKYLSKADNKISWNHIFNSARNMNT